MNARCANFEEAMNAFTAVPSSSRSVGTWKALIVAHVKKGESMKGISFFEEMVSSGVEPDEATLAIVLDACGDIGALTQGKKIQKGIAKVDDHLGASLIRMWGRCGNVKEALRVFNGLQHTSRGVNSWTAMIGMYVEHRHTNVALDLFNSMTGPDVGLNPNANTLHQVLIACGHVGLIDSALYIINTMQKKYGVKPNTLHHSYIVDAFRRAGLMQDADEYAKRQQIKANSEPSRLIGRSYIEVGGKVHEFTIEGTSDAEVCEYLEDLSARIKEAGYIPHKNTALNLEDSDNKKDNYLSHCSEILAVAFGILKTPAGTPLSVTSPNLKLSREGHEALKFIARLSQRKISVRDFNSWHHFDPGTLKCSCNDYW